MAPLNSLAELQLADRARDGDNAALEELYRRFRVPLYRHAHRMLRSDAAAQDVVQEAFARAIAAMPRTEGELKFKAWIYRIATNLCLKQLNQGNRWSASGQDQVEAAPASDPAGDPERGRRAVEIAAFVSDALEAMPPRYRQILLLRELDELSYDELASALDLDRNRVKVTLHRARARFAALFIAARVRAEPTAAQCAELAALVQQEANQRQMVGHLETCDRCRRREHRPASELFALLPPIAVPEQLGQPAPAGATAAGASAASVTGGTAGTLGLLAAALIPVGVVTAVLMLSPSPRDLKHLARASLPAVERVQTVIEGAAVSPAGAGNRPAAAIPAAAPSTRAPTAAATRLRPRAAPGSPVEPPRLRLKLRFAPGTVFVQRGGKRLALVKDLRLQVADVLEPVPGHAVGILLPGDQRLTNQGRLRLDAMPVRGGPVEVRVTLLSGELSARTTRRGGGITILVGGRRLVGEGGELRLRFQGQTLRLESLDAYVTVHGPHARRVVSPGTRLTLRASGPGFVRHLLPAPRDLRPVKESGPRPPRLRWKPVPTARGYRVQIAADAQFMELERTLEVSVPSLQPPPLPPGKHYWRVVASEGGQLGLPSKIFSFDIQ